METTELDSLLLDSDAPLWSLLLSAAQYPAGPRLAFTSRRLGFQLLNC